MLKEVLQQLVERKDLSQSEVSESVQELLSNSSAAEIAAFLVLLKAKGETVEEITGVIQAMQQKMVPVNYPGKLLDIVGTGGDNAHTINISTGSALVAASCGVKIAKHGNRSVSSLCGAADVLQELGITLNLTASQIAECLETIGIAFLFAPEFHPAMKVIAPVRRSLKLRTVFNLVGPLLNPARAKYMMIGVYDPLLLRTLPKVLQNMGTEHSLFFHGQGLDELSCVGPVQYAEVASTEITYGVLDPQTYGLKKCTVEDLKGGTAKENANVLEEILQGQPGPIADTLALNAGVALYLYGFVNDIGAGIEQAQNSLENGRPYQLLNQWRALCQTF